MNINVLFSGSRDAATEMLLAVRGYITTRINPHTDTIIVGDAGGIDYEVIRVADELEIPIQVHGTNQMRHVTWTGSNITHKGMSYLQRDRHMASLIGPQDRAVIVWNGISRKCGTVATARYVSQNTLLVYWLWATLEDRRARV
jgi:hypothetical protein